MVCLTGNPNAAGNNATAQPAHPHTYGNTDAGGGLSVHYANPDEGVPTASGVDYSEAYEPMNVCGNNAPTGAQYASAESCDAMPALSFTYERTAPAGNVTLYEQAMSEGVGSDVGTPVFVNATGTPGGFRQQASVRSVYTGFESTDVET